MPFRGRPLERCYACSQRRIKCDRTRPGCTQCTLRDVRCPGYRPAFSLEFQDESQQVARKVHQKRHNGRNASPPQQKVIKVEDVDRPAMVASVDISVQDVAIKFLFSSYLQWTTLELISEFGESSPPTSATLFAIQASALAALGQGKADKRIMAMARSQYAIALQQTNAALTSPDKYLQDDTLASVVYLSLFEAITFNMNEKKSVEAWNAHISGALELLKQRGMSQFSTPVGRQLYRVISADIRVKCIQLRLPVPEDFREYEAEVSQYFDSDGLAYPFRRIMDDFSDFVPGATWTGRESEDENHEKFVNTAIQLEYQLGMLSRNMLTKSAWQYTRGADPSPYSNAWQGQADVYPSLVAARIWNHIRQIRLLVNKWLFFVWSTSQPMTPPSEHLLDAMQASHAVCENMWHEILASVGPLLSTEPSRDWIYLVMPLWSVGKAATAPLAAKEYARDRLFQIGREARLSQALWAAKVVDSLIMGVHGKQQWLVDPMLSFAFSHLGDVLFTETMTIDAVSEDDDGE